MIHPLLRAALAACLAAAASAAAAQPASTAITWHPDRDAPVQVAEPGLTTDLAYDAQGRLLTLTQTDTTGHVAPFPTAGRTRTWTFAYGPGGVLASVDGPLPGPADTVSYAYTPQGALLTVTDELGHVTTATAWNGRGQPTSVTDPNGVVTAYGYDALGRLTSVTVDPASGAAGWTFAYTPAGDVATAVDPRGASYAFTWDGARRLAEIVDNAGGRITYARDAMGNVTSREVRDGAGVLRAREGGAFDELGRLIRQVGGEGRTWSFAYDRTGLLKSAADPRAKALSYGYDALGRLVAETERDGGTAAHGYDGRDAQTSYTDPRGLRTDYLRNGFGEVIREASPDRGVTVTDHDPRGLPVSRTDGRGVTVAYAYDAAGRLLSRTYPDPALNETFTYDATAGGNRGVGRLTGVAGPSGTLAIAYDAHGRVVREARTTGGRSYETTYGWSAAGTLAWMRYPSGRVVSYGYDALGGASSVAWAPGPGQPSQPVAGGGVRDPFGPLRALDHANGIERRVTRDLEGAVTGLLLSGGGTDLVARSYLWGTG